MKAEVGGVLLSATSRDANNQMFSLVVGVVTKENKNNWIWFLTCLMEALDCNHTAQYIIISDRQKVRILMSIVILIFIVILNIDVSCNFGFHFM